MFDAPDPSDTGGVDLPAHAGQIGGSIPGFKTAVRLASRTPEWREVVSQGRRQAGKDFNDAPVGSTVGADQGQRVVDVTGLTDDLL